MKTTLKNNLPNNMITKSAYSASRLIFFKIKLKIKQNHQHDVIYYAKCPEETCKENYIGKTGRRLSARIMDPSGRDRNSHGLKHCIENEYKLLSREKFTILGANYNKNKFRKVQSQCI